jgi:hypothetical protein
VSALDLPSGPEESGRPERSDDGGAYRLRIRDLPDPEERERAYEAIRAHVSVETLEEASPGRQTDGNDRRSYWDEVPRLFGSWAKHQEKWPVDRQPVVDRSADPLGSYRSDGGFYLNPEQHAEAVAARGRAHKAEPMVSADMQQVEQENRHGGWLEGIKDRLKSDDRLKEKVAEGLATIGPDAKPEELVQQVPDAIRYTFCLRQETYSEGYYDIKERLESLGYEMYQAKNSWTADEYKGVNTRWVTGAGQRFEVQVHTPESSHAKQYVTHDAYERIRNPLTTDDERSELVAFQREVSSRIEVPEGAANIPDFKKEGF